MQLKKNLYLKIRIVLDYTFIYLGIMIDKFQKQFL